MRKKSALAAILIVLTFGVQNVVAQHKSDIIHGKVYGMNDGKKEVLAGANVYWKFTTQGTTTDSDGHYEIQVNDSIHCLVFSFVGYLNDTVHGMKQGKEYNHTMTTPITLDEVNVTARQSASYISSLEPVHTENITAAGLRRAACCNLAESFETNASVDVNYSDAVTGAKQIELLGLSGLYTQMMAENMPTLRGLAATLGLAYVPGSWMHAIQVSKGTSSVQNGYESISGQINIDYKQPEPDMSDKLYVNLYQSTMGMGEINLNARHSFNDNLHGMILAHVGGNALKNDHNNDGFLDDPLSAQYNVFGRLNYAKGNFEGKFGIRALQENRISGQVNFNADERETGGNYGIQLNTDRYEAFLKTGFIFDRPETSLGVQQQVTYHALDSYFGNTDYDANQMSYYANALYASYIGNTQHKYTAGFSFTYDRFNETLSSSSLSFADSVRTDVVPGAFFEYNYNNGHDWSVLAGLRIDHHNRYGFFATPRFHLRYTLLHETTLRFSLGKGYRMPNVLAENTTILASSRNLIFTGLSLKMEEAWNLGTGINHHFDIGSREVKATLDYFHTNFSNQIILDRDADAHAIYVYNLNGKSFSNSAQIELNCEVVRDFDVTMAFRYNDVRMTINDTLREKPLVNRYKGLITMSYAPETWQFDFTVQLNGDSRVPSLAGNAAALDSQKIQRSPAYVIMNAQISKKIKKSWEIYVGGENLTNYMQHNPIVAYDNPFGENFDSSLVWGPLSGIRAYAGLRYTIK